MEVANLNNKQFEPLTSALSEKIDQLKRSLIFKQDTKRIQDCIIILLSSQAVKRLMDHNLACLSGTYIVIINYIPL